MMRALYFLARLAFGAVFVYAGAEKMADPATFADVIFNYRMLPGQLVYPVALFLPALEVVCGLALWTGCMARAAAGILNLLMAAFMLGLGQAMLRGLDVTCGCFGGAGQAVTGETLLRDAAILAVGLLAQWGAVVQARDDAGV
ncbi:hypothetical protein NNJEOMEG_00320 [Fundidesulfovibrio magnetotacticus]|uniref:Methylamine utilisation protein MauE domain-containing protein n=1 Tax=Fundidesulfovibrio magnetotacticus TaxID=2730080 RepID=A0A6V8LW53_9BACT|nr:MauE/DoxX family redox-associated membrane protein [Fundidesulfovibrio magnetotacticus]GFK92495.1 hypothetical protein NNJEOMEG_00320 [Fundidesulfovibrio magnetotacticus]